MLIRYLSKNSITQVNKGAFSGLTSMKGLTMFHNKVSELGSLAFYGLDSITVLSIQHNLITSCSKDAFANLKAIKGIYLQYNKIQSLVSWHAMLRQRLHTDMQNKLKRGAPWAARINGPDGSLCQQYDRCAAACVGVCCDAMRCHSALRMHPARACTGEVNTRMRMQFLRM